MPWLVPLPRAIQWPVPSSDVIQMKHDLESLHSRDTLPSDSLLPMLNTGRSIPIPSELYRITGFDFIDSRRIVCTQEAVGSIFVVNIQTKKVEKEIPFGPPGRYESIVLVDKSAFIASGDGRLFEVANFSSPRISVKEYGTHLTVRQEMSGLCYDKESKRLLVAIRGVEEGSNAYKGIYSFDLASRTMSVNPAIKIDLNDSSLNKINSRKLQSLVQPSDIAINGTSANLYICDATKSQLLVLNQRGETKNIYAFPRNKITQPEGIRFTPSGELYVVSSGSKDEQAKLLLVKLPSN